MCAPNFSPVGAQQNWLRAAWPAWYFLATALLLSALALACGDRGDVPPSTSTAATQPPRPAPVTGQQADSTATADEPAPSPASRVEEPTPTRSAEISAQSAGYLMDDDHGIAIKGVSRGSFSVDDAVRPFVAFHIAVLSLREDPALAPKTQIFINGDEEVCFGSDAQEECLRDFWGLDGQSGAELYEPWFRVNEATSPRGKGIQMSLLFLGVPETVEQATIEFGEHRIPIDLGSGMTGQVPTYDYKLHYAEFAVGLVLYDSNHKKVVLEKTLIQEPHGAMILVFSAENGSDTTEFVPVIELAGSRVSKSGVMFDGVFHPTKGWTPKTVRIEGGILSPGQRSVFEHSIPIGPGDDDTPWGPICLSLDPAKRSGGVLMQFTVSEPLSGTATTVSEAGYLDYPLNEKVGCSPGSLLWRYPLGYPSPVTPAISGGVVYSGDHEGFLHVLDAENRRRALVPSHRRQHPRLCHGDRWQGVRGVGRRFSVRRRRRFRQPALAIPDWGIRLLAHSVRRRGIRGIPRQPLLRCGRRHRQVALEL